MTYEEFQHLARLFIVGSLDEEENEQFCAARIEFGRPAEAFILECQKLNTIFALSLRPMPPAPSTKQRLLARIKKISEQGEGSSEQLDLSAGATRCREFIPALRFPGRN